MSKTLIVNIGDEILSGHTVNTNASYICRKLYDAGITTDEVRVIPDTSSALKNILKNSVGLYKNIIISGGLGPTHDDQTKNILCEYFSSQLNFNQDVWNNIKELFSHRNITISNINKEQAMFPDKAKPIHNKYGTAPGIHFSEYNSEIFVLPGVPVEMKAMTDNYVLPFIEKRNKEFVIYRDINTYNIPESTLYEKLSSAKDFPFGSQIAFLPKGYGITVRVKASGYRKNDIIKSITCSIDRISEIIPEHILGYDIEEPQYKLFDLLNKNKMKISFAESCTGGLAAKIITDIPGSSAVFEESYVTYSNDAKFKILSVNPQTLVVKGAVSEETVEEMLDGLLAVTAADVVCAVSGIAGPDGGTETKPVGTIYIGAALRKNNIKTVRHYHIIGDRETIRKRTAGKLFVQTIELLTKR